jgi:hypothetical protein
MLRLGIMHNDLHLNNVFVDVLPSPITMTYVVDGDDHFAVPVSAFARIYDFDWGFMFNHAPNEMTAKTCRTTGICRYVDIVIVSHRSNICVMTYPARSTTSSTSSSCSRPSR